MLTILVAILAAFGLCSMLWLLFGTLLMPVGTTKTLEIRLLTTGDGADIEQTIYGLSWLRQAGFLGGTIHIVDCGLTPKGRAEVEYLCSKRFPFIVFST